MGSLDCFHAGEVVLAISQASGYWARYYDLSPLFVNFYALGFTCSWHNHAHTMGLHALAKAPSPTQALKIKMYRGQIKPEFFLQEPPDKRTTRIGMGGPKTRAISEEVL